MVSVAVSVCVCVCVRVCPLSITATRGRGKPTQNKGRGEGRRNTQRKENCDTHTRASEVHREEAHPMIGDGGDDDSLLFSSLSLSVSLQVSL